MPRLSVITGYYNRRHVLERTVRSILDQTYSDFELLVFDDASTDGTADELARLARELDDPRFRYKIHQSNIGFTRGLIEAIADTSGELIAIQASGDVSQRTRLEKQVATLDANSEVGVVGCWYYNVMDATGKQRLRKPDGDSANVESLLSGNFMSHGEVMYRRSAYDQAGGYRPEFKFAQDYDLWLRLAEEWQFRTVPEPLYFRSIQFDGVSYDPRRVVQQSKYSLLARRLAEADDELSLSMLARVREEGPGAWITDSDATLQKRHLNSALRSAIWGDPDGAKAISRNAILSRSRRWFVYFVATALGESRSVRRKPIERIFGIR